MDQYVSGYLRLELWYRKVFGRSNGKPHPSGGSCVGFSGAGELNLSRVLPVLVVLASS